MVVQELVTAQILTTALMMDVDPIYIVLPILELVYPSQIVIVLLLYVHLDAIKLLELIVLLIVLVIRLPKFFLT
jgi:hypothetical protein